MRDSERMLNGRGGRTVYRFNRLVVCGRIPNALEVVARVECVVEPAEDEWGCHC